MRTAYSYTRFSTTKQEDGTSLERQSGILPRFIKRHSSEMVLDETVTFHDAGVSGWRGKNVEHGRLGDFIRLVETGVIAKGSLLLIENMDRITRMKPRLAHRLLERIIIDLGIEVVTLKPEKRYTQAVIDDEPGAFQNLTGIFERAHGESSRKSDLVSESYVIKWRNFDDDGKLVTGMAPAWLTKAVDGKTWLLDEAKAAVVRRIFDLAIAGYGAPKIAKLLNDEGVPVMKYADSWNFGTVNAILKNEAVLGNFVSTNPNFIERFYNEPRDEFRRDGYYQHQIVEPTRYHLARSALTQRHRTGRAGDYCDNLFPSLCWCKVCGARMRVVGISETKLEAGGTVRHSYMRCTNATVNKAICTAPRFPMRAVERAVLLNLTQQLADRLDRASNPDRVDPRVLLQAQIAEGELKQARLTAAIADMDYPGEIIKQANAVGAQLVKLRQELANAKPLLTAEESHEFSKMVDMLQGVEAMPIEVRRRVQVEARRLISRIDFDPDDDGKGNPAVNVTFTDEAGGGGSGGLQFDHLLEKVGGNRRKLS